MRELAIKTRSTMSVPSCQPRNGVVYRPAARRGVVIRAEAAMSPPVRDKPLWTGDSMLSRVVNWAINTPPLYGAMKVMAKQAMKNSAESRGVRWDAHVQELQRMKELEELKSQFEAPALTYPDYYLKPFHAYPAGNLEWLAAYEVEPATYAIAIRTFKDKKEWTPAQCFERLRGGVTDALKSYHAQHGLPSPSTIVDMGCSTGMSTQWLAEQFPAAAAVTGLDLSPYFLAVAEYERRRRAAAPSQKPAAPITYLRGLAEQSPFADGSLDMVNFNFVIHECPSAVIDSFISESARVLRPGGVLAFIDNNPRSATIQNLPPALFTLMKSTEPWSDQYYSYDLEAAMRAAGFREVVTVETDHRHRCVMGIRPA